MTHILTYVNYNFFKKVGWLFALFLFMNVHAQSLSEKERELQGMYLKLFEAETITQKLNINDSIVAFFKPILKSTESINYSFDSLNIGKLKSDDEVLRIFTWNVPLSSGYHKYFGFVQVYDKKNKLIFLHTLSDSVALNTDMANKRLTPGNWYGALYYEIIDNDVDGEKIYTVLGFDFNNLFTKKKVIDIIGIDQYFNIYFGKPYFSDGRNTSSRIIFEYSVRSQMTLRYDTRLKMLVFDHLSPRDPSKVGDFQFYGPDFSYDGFKFDDNAWMFQKDVDVRN